MKIWMVGIENYNEEDGRSWISPQIFTTEELAKEYQKSHNDLEGCFYNLIELQANPQPLKLRSVSVGTYSFRNKSLFVRSVNEQVSDKTGTHYTDNGERLEFWSDEGHEAIEKKLEFALKKIEQEQQVAKIINQCQN